VLFVPALMLYTFREIKANLKPFIIGLVVAASLYGADCSAFIVSASTHPF
jgi:hypothetical protein